MALYWNPPSGIPGADARRRVSLLHCRLCANPCDSDDTPKYLMGELAQCVLNELAEKPPPYHVTLNNVSTPLRRLKVGTGSSRRCTRRSGLDSLTRPGRGRWTSTILTAAGLFLYWAERRTSTTKPTAYTVRCALLRNESSLAVTVSAGVRLHAMG